jgi:hypothetical protein
VGRQHAHADRDEEESARVTLLIGGPHAAQDFLVEGALRGLGYNVEYFGMADNAGSRRARSSATAASATRRTSPSATW